MMGFGIAGLIVAFLVFAELHSIEKTLESKVLQMERNQELRDEYRRIKWQLKDYNESLKELMDYIISTKGNSLTEEEEEMLRHAKYIITVSEDSENTL